MLKIKGHGRLRGDMVFWKFFERVEDESGRIALKVVFFREGYSDRVGIHLHAFEIGHVIYKSMLENLSGCEIYYVSENNDNVFIFIDDDGGIIVAKDTLHNKE